VTLSSWLDLAVAIGTFSLALAAAYTAASAEYGRRLDTRRRQVERILDATVDFANAAATQVGWASEAKGAMLDVARRRLHAELQMAGVRGYESTELMVRTVEPELIVRQGEAAFLEIGARLDEVAPRSLLAVVLRRPPHRREIVGKYRT
jgi:hypothetical protein